MKWQVSLHDLDAFAVEFWKQIGDKKVFAFHGQMGAGKTTTIAALCAAKGLATGASSPTFSIINEYAFEENGMGKKIFHIDLYRLKDEEEISGAGVEECVDSGDICFIEWPEKAPYLFDEDSLHLVIEPVNETMRNIHLLNHTEFTGASLKEHL